MRPVFSEGVCFDIKYKLCLRSRRDERAEAIGPLFSQRLRMRQKARKLPLGNISIACWTSPLTFCILQTVRSLGGCISIPSSALSMFSICGWIRFNRARIRVRRNSLSSFITAAPNRSKCRGIAALRRANFSPGGIFQKIVACKSIVFGSTVQSRTSVALLI